MTKTQGEEIATINEKMLNVEKNIEEIKGDIKTIMMAMPSASALKTEIQGLKDEIKEIKNANAPLKVWFKNSLSAALGSIMTFLILEYLRNAR